VDRIIVKKNAKYVIVTLLFFAGFLDLSTTALGLLHGAVEQNILVASDSVGETLISALMLKVCGICLIVMFYHLIVIRYMSLVVCLSWTLGAIHNISVTLV